MGHMYGFWGQNKAEYVEKSEVRWRSSSVDKSVSLEGFVAGGVQIGGRGD